MDGMAWSTALTSGSGGVSLVTLGVSTGRVGNNGGGVENWNVGPPVVRLGLVTDSEEDEVVMSTEGLPVLDWLSLGAEAAPEAA